jgi:hypothetical protein
MTRVARRTLQIALASLAVVGALFVSEKVSLTGMQPIVSQAEAWIGRPLTPMSYAGVARRTMRRGYAYGGAYGVAGGYYGAPIYGAPVVYAPPVYGDGCYQVVGPYGGVVTRCP